MSNEPELTDLPIGHPLFTSTIHQGLEETTARLLGTTTFVKTALNQVDLLANQGKEEDTAMSRTRRSYRKGRGRDGKQDWTTIIARDNHVTGLRDQKRDRHIARVALRTEEDTVLSGKYRRYSNRYGAYEH